VATDFVGYDRLSAEAKVLALVKDGQAVERVTEGESVELVVDKTPFYGEAGGQVGDQGVVEGKDFQMTVSDARKDPNNLIILTGEVTRGSLSAGETVSAQVDCTRRTSIARNHTATHLLHAALRQVLGEHVKQSGSLVSPERLRFDFTHFSALDSETLKSVETLVNEKIFENTPVQVEEMEADEALEAGATALFEEKYGERVRVVAVGDFSKELCGGTHTSRTGDIGLFKIVLETSVAAGVRRIEALTGVGALQYVQDVSDSLHQVAGVLKVSPEGVVERVEKLMSDLKAMEKELSSLKSKALAEASVDGALSGVREVDGTPVLVQEVSADGPGALRDLADQLKAKMGSGVIVLGSRTPDKVQLVAVVTSDQLKKHHAGNLVKEVAAIVGGGGGGRPDMAQAGGSRPERLPEALEAVYDIVARE
jgi:alanyl-tRNA synthetase